MPSAVMIIVCFCVLLGSFLIIIRSHVIINKPIYGYMLPNLSPSPNLYKVQSVYNNNVAS